MNINLFVEVIIILHRLCEINVSWMWVKVKLFMFGYIYAYK